MSNEEILAELNKGMTALHNGIKNVNQALSSANQAVLQAEAYNKGLEDGRNEVWELAKKIIVDFRNMTGDEFLYIFGCYCTEVFVTHTPQEALAKLEAYEKEQNKIRVGDVLKAKVDGTKCVVSSDKVDNCYVLTFPDGSGSAKSLTFIEKHYVKTGKHIDIQNMLNQIKE